MAMVIADLKLPGDGLIVHDTATGIDWLNLCATAGMSRKEVESTLASAFAGFQFAGPGNLSTFFANAGISPINEIGVDGENPAISKLLQHWGLLCDSPGEATSLFLFASAVEENPAGYLAQFHPPAASRPNWSANITAGRVCYGLEVGEACLGSALMRGGTLDMSGDFES